MWDWLRIKYTARGCFNELNMWLIDVFFLFLNQFVEQWSPMKTRGIIHIRLWQHRLKLLLGANVLAEMLFTTHKKNISAPPLIKLTAVSVPYFLSMLRSDFSSAVLPYLLLIYPQISTSPASFFMWKQVDSLKRCRKVVCIKTLCSQQEWKGGNCLDSHLAVITHNLNSLPVLPSWWIYKCIEKVLLQTLVGMLFARG